MNPTARSDQRPEPAIMHDDVRCLLATDLDGTFLAGSPEQRLRLYQLISRREDMLLVYVTGRGLEAVLPLLADPTLPHPDYIICDVGATVVDGHDIHAVEPLQGRIAARWPGEQAVVRHIGEHEGLIRQDVPQERRVSYFCSSDAISDKLEQQVRELGCELLHSAERYLDILPFGVNKGATLRGLIDHLGIPDERVLVAGDTLNDRSMYGKGFAGVCVGRSEPGLIEATRDIGQTLHAEKPGCGGILEALAHFELLDAEHLDTTDIVPDTGKAELVMVYHRLPYEEVVEDGQIQRRRPKSPNGIIPTLLSFFADGRKGSWIAWSIHDPAVDEDFEVHTAVDAQRYPDLTAARVALTKKDVDIFYKSFSKEAFWPLLHTFWERARFREKHWQVFCRVNRAFAERAAAEAASGATVWIHDYNLWMVPAYLRELRPDVRIAFFHHTHFPSADVFNVVPWRRDIIGSLLQCDYVGFHIPRQVENFVDVVRGVAPVKVIKRENCAPRFLTYGCAAGLDRVSRIIDVGRRRVHVGAHPVGLDVDRVRRLLESDDSRLRRRHLSSELDGRKLILSVERLDYTKGTLQKLQAYERMLERNPDLVGEITLFCVCVPAAKEMTVYRQLQTQIEQAVGRINGRFSQLGWTPVQFFFRALPFEELLSYYGVADVMWITPLRDGLNLVAKEYVAVQGIVGHPHAGVLVLSEFAGAAAELKGALLTNPHDIEDLAEVCLRAIRMDAKEAGSRLQGLFDIVEHHNLSRWGQGFLDAVAETGDSPGTSVPASA
ncbi:glucosylglycerol-phosphate synthase [Oleiagrimonas soli]|uniref:Glucosylglycerol-phosphate synthase n=2 Tax=Oleiagrimonas soli TaxID=1543381 RepID=A0A841KU43_9GAMM|nr:glucosylglycerol-phosphate synthase [Oleiagrimonas soli]MBB6185458.1 glucosylglycerol-phosphate synthase [Oleiagrimonas soli]